MKKQILTLDSLYQFFVEQNKTTNFSSANSGKPIVVTTNGYFEADESEIRGMLKLKLKVCHTLLNRNGSYISTENMEKALPTLKYRPILAYIHTLPNGLDDFYSHNMEIVENEDGDAELKFIEKQVGCFTADEPWLEYDKEKDKTYVIAYAVIPEEYTEAANIIRRKKGTKVSCELIIDDLSYNAKEKYLELNSFYFGGCTLLGCDDEGNEIGEGMEGSRADIADFCHKEPTFTYQEKMIDILEKLNATLSNFNTTTTQEGGNEMKFEELLAKYGKTAEDITFEVEGLSDEELEAKFAELFDGEGDAGDAGDSGETEADAGAEPTSDEGEPEAEPATEDPAPMSEENDDDSEEDNDDSEDETDDGNDKTTPSKKKKVENSEVKFELSHDDIRYALYNLINAISEDGYLNSWIVEVYDSKFIYEDCADGRYYRQKYIKNEDNIALDGDPIEVFNEWLSTEEKEALDALKAEYATLKSFKEQYDVDKDKAEKEAVFDSAEYAEVKETDEFKSLINNAEKYSVEELKIKADLLFAACMKQKLNFESGKSDVKHNVGININAKNTKKKQAFGGIFDD